MDWKQGREIIHPLGHIAVELCEGRKVLADPRELVRCLLQQSVGNDEFHIRGRNLDLLKAVFNAAQTVRNVRESSAIEDSFLNTGHEAEAQIFADFADFAQ